MSPSAAPAVRRRLPRAEREQQLLDVAEQVFGERGVRAATMDEIAERAGVSKPVLYDHFGSKDGLLVACTARARSQLLEDTVQAVGGSTSIEERLERGFRAFFTFLDDHHASWPVLLGESAAVGGLAAREVEAVRRQQVEFIVAALGDALPHVPHDELEPLAEGVVGASERLALWRRPRPEVSVEDAARHAMRLVWGGLRSLQDPPAISGD